MRYLVSLLVVAVALVTAGTASAGGWATVGVDPQPTGVGPGDTWHPEITILQHGVTPLGGLTPVVMITQAGGDETRTFTAAETAKVGIYEAEVVFPEAGDWNVVVESGFGDSRLTFGPVAIEDGPGGVSDPGSFPVAPILAVAVVLVLLAAATLVFRRRWHPTAFSR